MSDVNKALARQFYERLSAGDLTVVDELVSADFIEHEPVPGLTPSKEGVRQLFEMFHSAFDHAAIQIEDLIAEGDKVFALARMTGHHRDEFLGIPASGNTIDVGVCDLFRVDNGAIVEHWGIMDAASMMHQLTA